MSSLAMRSVVVSETGRRQNNEDAAFASSRLAAIADGVGGAAAGEVASGRLAIQKMIALDKRRIVRPLAEELRDAVVDANAAVDFAIFYDAAHAGMGTTLTTVALSNEGDYLIANVGDSRAYLLRDRELRRLTRDDSLVQELIDRGVLQEGEARHHPQRSVVLAALDGAARPRPAIRAVTARAGDRLLLCSDGVSDYMADDQIADVLAKRPSRDAAQALVDVALRLGLLVAEAFVGAARGCAAG